MKLIQEVFGAIKLIQFEKFGDERGFFSEVFRADMLSGLGINDSFVQENQSISYDNVIRGLHLQYIPKQSKLIRVVKGTAKFIELDFRPGDTYGKHAEFIINDSDNVLLWVPFGFANGFLSMSDELIVNYKVTDYWNNNGEVVIKYDSPELNINWQITNPNVSAKDIAGLTFSDFTQHILPKINF